MFGSVMQNVHHRLDIVRLCNKLGGSGLPGRPLIECYVKILKKSVRAMSALLSTIIRIIKQIVKYLIILKASLFRLSCCCCCFCILYLMSSFWRIYRRRRHCRL